MTSDRVTETEPVEGGSRKQSVFRIAEPVRAAHGADSATVLDILHGKLFCLNSVGSRVIELLKQRYSEAEMADQLAREFSIDQRIIEADQREFLLTLERHGLVFRCKDPLA